MLDLGPKGLSVATLILVGLTVLCLIFAGTRLAPWVVCSETREGCDRDCLDDARRPAHLTVSACLSGCRDVHTNCDNGTLSSAIILVFSSVVQILSLWLLYYSHYRDVKREYGSFQDFVAQRLGDTVFYVIDSVKDCFSCCRSSSPVRESNSTWDVQEEERKEHNSTKNKYAHTDDDDKDSQGQVVNDEAKAI